MRGRPKEIPKEELLRRFTRVFKGEDLDTTWTYDLDVTTTGPISVSIKYHKTEKQFEQEAKAAKDINKQEKSQNKFFKDKDEVKHTVQKGRKRKSA
jgi:hypothetical protein